MKKLFVYVLIIALAVPIVSFAASTLLPIGGIVTVTKPCDEGLLLTVKTSKGLANYLWFWGNLPFASYIVPHPKQNILGKVSLTPAPCTIDGVPYEGGLPIIFHGSSK